MATLTIQSHAPANTGASYAQNVSRAARALLAALLAFGHSAAAPAAPRAAKAVRARDELSLYRLYCLSSPYDSIMPNLRQELQAMACRDDGEQ